MSPMRALVCAVCALALVAAARAYTPIPAECTSTGTAGVDLQLTRCTYNSPDTTADLRGCGITSILANCFDGNVVRTLYLAGNPMKHFDEDIFNGLTVHFELDLASMPDLIAVKAGFTNGLNCRSCYLFMDSSPKLSVVQPGSFPYLMAADLDLMFGNITTIQSGAFANMVLGQFSLDNNPLVTVEKDAFTNTTVTNIFSLASITAPALGSNWFSGLTANDVMIQFNENLETIQGGAFQDIRAMNSITVQKNSALMTIETGAFSDAATKDLTIEGVSVETVHQMAFAAMDLTGTMKLELPAVTQFDSGAFNILTVGGDLTLIVDSLESMIEATFGQTKVAGSFTLVINNPDLQTYFSFNAFSGLNVARYCNIITTGTLQLTTQSFGGISCGGTLSISANRGVAAPGLPSGVFEGAVVGGLNITNLRVTSIIGGVFKGLQVTPPPGILHGEVDIGPTVTFIALDALITANPPVLVGARLLAGGMDVSTCLYGNGILDWHGTPVCTGCQPGYYCVSGEQVPCPAGTYNPLPRAFAISACHQCPLGTGSAAVGASDASTCAPCSVPAGTVQPAYDHCTVLSKGGLSPGVIAIIVIVSLLACGGGMYLGWRKGCHHAAGFSKLANLGRSNDNFALLGSGASPAPEKQYGTPSMPQKKYDTQVDMYNGGDDQL